MDALIAILYYMHVLVCGGTYSTDQINAMVCTNQDQINTIYSNPDLMNKVYTNYSSFDAPTVEVTELSTIDAYQAPKE